MKTEIIKIKGDWEEVVNDCRSTVNRLFSETGRTFTCTGASHVGNLPA